MYRMLGLALNRASLTTVAVALFVLLIWPVTARVVAPPPTAEPVAACACCADDGEWYERTDRLDSSHLSELERLRFAGTANRYETAADEGEFSSTFSLSHRRNGRRWELRFRDQDGKTGTLSFTIPASVVFFGTDLREMPPGSAGPILYKEWRFSGAAQATGIFKSGVGPQRFRLILQGRGNNCPAAEDFKHWTLQLSGGRTGHAFYGKLDTPK
ncbi:MAG TPA: hypothetical protein VF544_24745 [Pyrinomonadaceae bacterium]